MRAISGLREIADTFDVVVLDQWGVLHDGSRRYEHAAEALHALAANGKRILVLSNSGKRSDLNLERIADCGLPVDDIEIVMTSGEALWRDVRDGALAPFSRPLAITGAANDAARWSEGLSIEFVDEIGEADALLVMGLPDGARLEDHDALLGDALARGLTLVCPNPDRSSPRANGETVIQPGALAAAYEARGGSVEWYGKPHGPIFEAVERFAGVPPQRLLMVGDSPEHDIAGGARAGWRTCLVRGGLHARMLRPGTEAQVTRVCEAHGSPLPDLHIGALRW